MSRIFRSLTISIVGAALAVFAPAMALAQKPALTQNVDERGRVPYQIGANCNNQASDCNAVFPAISAGFRLVVTYISGQSSHRRPLPA